MEKRKRAAVDSDVVTLIYAAPGHKRFAKLLTEASLDEIKEVVRKRLNFPSASSFLLSYNNDIALENDDDFDAFIVYTNKSSSPSIDVLIEIKDLTTLPHLPQPIDNAISFIIDQTKTTTTDTAPPPKKRKVADDSLLVPAPTESASAVKSIATTTKPISTAAKAKKPKLGEFVQGGSNPAAGQKKATESNDIVVLEGQDDPKRKSQIAGLPESTAAAPKAASRKDASSRCPCGDTPVEGIKDKLKRTKPKAVAPRRTKKSVEENDDDGEVMNVQSTAQSKVSTQNEGIEPAASGPEAFLKGLVNAIPGPIGVEQPKPKAKAKKDAVPISNVNLSSVSGAETAGVSDASVGHTDPLKQAARNEKESSDSDCDTPHPPPKLSRPSITDMDLDLELDAITRNPNMSVADLITEDDDEGEGEKQNVVLETDNEDDLHFRRRSRRFYNVESSDDEGVDERRSIPPVEVPESRRSSLRSQTAPLLRNPPSFDKYPTTTLIDAHQTQSTDIDSSGDRAVDQVMASDEAMFGLAIRSGSERAAVEEDPILPADEFPLIPNPVCDESPSPSPQDAVLRQKGHKRLSQIEPPITISPKPEEVVEKALPPKLTRKRSAAALATNPDEPPPKRALREKTVEPEAPAQRRKRGPNKTPEQKALEAEAKATLKEALEKVKKEKGSAKITAELKAFEAQAKAAYKEAMQKSKRDGGLRKPPEQEAFEAAAKAAYKEAQEKARKERNFKALALKKIAQKNVAISPDAEQTTPMSTASWTVLAPASSLEDANLADESQRDELRSSSREPHVANQNSDDEEEEEINIQLTARSQSSKNTPSTTTYRRLTDITSQPFATPTLSNTPKLTSTVPRVRKGRKDMYGDDSSSDSSDEQEVQSHIPKSRRAGAKK
ncbi:Carbamoyl-phosphate synthase [Mycena indigotica]|uniref:Carbamoyl-phosphate synthase n=1 Tax=Mycena indigotica TaxID=2126181 RepID=A0A8H6TDM8_9AGAR|nr:Carbamoyl-phosphate synthase [Mycena indigotica]KAF7315540.1 Carbamoyl-phosphate synthase [Mycena indigotica]